MSFRQLRLLASIALPALLLASPSGADTERDPRQIRLAVGRFDPLGGRPVVPASLRHATEPAGGYFVVQFAEALRPELVRALRGSGAVPLSYVPERAYLIRLAGPREKAALRKVSGVRWVGPVQPGWKISPDLGARPFRDASRRSGGRLHVTVDLFPGEPVESARAAIEAIGATQVHSVNITDTVRFRARASRAQIEAIARIDSVAWIEERAEIALRNNDQTWVVQTNTQDSRSVWNQGLHGEGQIIGHIDGPLDIDSCFFEDPLNNTPGPGHRKIVAYRSSVGFGSDPHGTHTAGTAAGKQTSGSLDHAGNAYEARISHTWEGDLTGLSNTASNLYSVLLDAYDDGARVHTNSWGDDGLTSYTTWCQDIDKFSYDYEDALVIFAVTNTGTLKTPENAKNVLAVGASQNGLSSNLFCGGGAGPTNDGRRKPEILAPGCNVVSAEDTAGCNTRSSSGTSMAAPAVAGSAALVRQYFQEGFYPTGSAVPGDAVTPSGALLKGILLNAGVDLTSLAGYPASREGWGRLLLEDALYFDQDVRALAVLADIRNANGLSTGAADHFPIQITGSTETLKLTLVFTEPPAALLASAATINDLDLELISPTGTLYRGNVFTLGSSSPGGAADPINNVEQIHISAPAIGEWTARVRGTAVNQSTQGYALVATGQLDASAGGSLRYESHSVDDPGPLGNGDGVLDPGETATLSVSLVNLRLNQTSQIGAKLSGPGSSTARVTQNLADFPDLQPGASDDSLAPHYTVTLNPDAACGDALPLDLDVTHADGGNRSSFTLPVGLTGLDPVALDTPLSMPTFSASPTVSSIVIAEDLTIGDVNVTVDLTHEITEQVEITLTSPQGTMVVLHDRTPGIDVQTTFDRLTEPDGPGTMNDFDGESSQGTWTLSLLDDVIGLPITPGGTLNGWSLSIVASGGALCTPFSCGEAVPVEVATDLRLRVLSDTDLRFDWPALGGAAGYHVWRSQTPDFASEELVGESVTPSLVQAGAATAAETWYYVVRAINTCNWEGP